MVYRRFFLSMAAGTMFLTAVVSAASNLSASEQVLQNVDTLIRDNGCPGCNLRGADLNRMDLSGVDLSGADLTGASFFLTDLSEANLSGADLRDAQFGGADLANANLSGADLRDAVLDGAYLEGSVMDGIIIEKNGDPEEVEAALSEVVHVPDQVEPKEVMDQKKVAFEGEADDQVSTDQESPAVKSVTPIQQISIGEDGQKKNDQTVVDDSGENSGESTRSQEMQEKGSEVQADSSGKDEPSPAEAEKVVAAPVEVAPVEPEAVEPEADEQPPVEKENVVEVVAENSPDSALPVAMVSAETAAVIEAVEVDPQLTVLVEKLLDRKRCYGCNLQGADLQRKNLRKSDLERSVLDGANLEGADLEMANLKGVSFRGANLRNADLRKTDLYKADFSGADLTGADLGEALVDEAVFTDAAGYQPPLITQ